MRKVKKLKVNIVLLILTLIVVLIYTVSLFQDKKKKETETTQEKQLVVEDLNSLQSEFDKVVLEKNAAIEELSKANENIILYIDSIESMKDNITAISRYKNQLGILKTERKKVLLQLDSLTKSNNLILLERDSVFVELEKQTLFNDSLVLQNTQLTDGLDGTYQLPFSDISVVGANMRDVELINQEGRLLYLSLLDSDNPLDFNQLSKSDQFDYLSSNYELWKTNYINIIESLDSYPDEEYYSIATPDKIESRSKEELNKREFANFSVPIMTDDGDVVNVLFGITHDGVSADQKVSELLKEGLTDVLSAANKYLKQFNFPAIETIYIKCSTNGRHSEESNHKRGEAIDISRINNVPIIKTKESLVFLKIFENEVIRTINQDNSAKQLKIEGISMDKNLIELFERVKFLQLAIQELSYRRENFGPILKTFHYSANNDNLNYSVAGHEDHIHFSVR